MTARAKCPAWHALNEAQSCLPNWEHNPKSHICNETRGMKKTAEQVQGDLLRSVLETSWRFPLAVAVLGIFVAAGFSAWIYQIYTGIGVAGLNRPVFWGFYITNFVFWIGISHAGTLISAILRLANASWRRPITRCAEVITVFALMIGAMFPIVHLGRPWLAFWLVPYPSERGLWPNYRSPLLWDFFAINTYVIGSVSFLFLPIIPDCALLRDRSSGWRRRLYSGLCLGWRGTQKQWQQLETAMHIMAIVIIPVAVSVHSIVSWDFAMTPVPMWHSTIFAPYFVVGAIFSGIAALIVAMVLLRRFLHLEQYLPSACFDNLGKLLLLMCLLWVYFVFAERLTIWYGNHPAEVAVLWLTQNGPYRYLFWIMVACNFVIPFPLLAIKKFRTITGTCIASITVVVGMWLERYLIIVPSLSQKFLPYAWGTYRPTWVEITITAATLAAMALLYVVFAKFVPIISIWELKVGMREASVPMSSAMAVSRTHPAVPDGREHETAAGISFKHIHWVRR